MSALHSLARAAGLQVDWEDAAGEPKRVGDEALRRVLAALDLPAGDDAELRRSRERLATIAADDRFASGTVGEPLTVPTGAETDRAVLALEDGSERRVALERTADGWTLPAIDVTGYHRLHVGDRAIDLAIAPRRCFGVADAAPGRRIWGPAVQIPALRDARGTAFGDFTTLADAAGAFARAGADALAISPAHALYPADATRYSPYAPSSRLFLNILYADPGRVGVDAASGAAPDLIDWDSAIPERLRRLRAAYDLLSEADHATVRRYRAEKGEPLERHATFDALYAHFAADGAKGWQDWPADFHDPAGAGVERFARERADDVAFYAFAQWLAARGLDAAQSVAKAGGMAVGLIADLAVGMDAGGSHAWAARGDLLTGLSLGAPPDLLGPKGQNWGITGFSPYALRRSGFAAFRATITAAIDHAGGIRIDHALGLRRLWVVPEGEEASQGAFLTYPMDDMLNVLAIESQRARAIVIGEDLGTVPEGLRPAMDEAGVLGMRVLWFERDEDGAFVPPGDWSADAAAMTGTHDLPTVAGWWSERDIDWTWQLDRGAPDSTEADDRAQRAADRKQLWDALVQAEATTGQAPPVDAPQAVVTGALRHVAKAPSVLMIAPVEDLIGLVEQPNLPGTTDEHPNWRRRLPDSSEAILARPEVKARIDAINDERNR